MYNVQRRSTKTPNPLYSHTAHIAKAIATKVLYCNPEHFVKFLQSSLISSSPLSGFSISEVLSTIFQDFRKQFLFSAFISCVF